MTTAESTLPASTVIEFADDGLSEIDRLIVAEELLSPAQVARAQRVIARLEEKKSLAQIVVELGWLPQSAIDEVLHRHSRTMPLAEVMAGKGLVSREQIEAAMGADPANGQPPRGGLQVVRKLAGSGAVSERDILQTFCESRDLPFVDAAAALVDRDLLRKVSTKYLRRCCALPVEMKDGRLSVLIDRLDRLQVMKDLVRMFNCPVSVALSTRRAILTTLDELEREAAGGSFDAPSQTAASGSTTGSAIDTSGLREHVVAEDGPAESIPVIVDRMIAQAIRDGASDIHVEPMPDCLRVRYRVDGSLIQVAQYPRHLAKSIISRIKVLSAADVAEHRIHQDGRINLRLGEECVDLRISIYVTVHGESAVMRLLRRDRRMVKLEDMGFSKTTFRHFVEDVLEPATGIVLVTGPTGSGKTSTLYTAVDHINDISKKIITCEDPVEYVIPGLMQCSIADRPGINFVDSLKTIVRQDPDVILIGEIRDTRSAEMAVQCALTGHKVFSTFHTEDSVGALVRLLDMNIEGFLIASTVTAVLAQRLVRRQCAECRAPYTPSPRELRALGIARDDLADRTLTRGRGCAACLRTGYKGRLGIHELLLVTDPMRDAILQKKPTHELRSIAFESPGFVCLQEDGIAKALKGETTLTEVIENAPRSQFVRPLRRLMEIYEH